MGESPMKNKFLSKSQFAGAPLFKRHSLLSGVVLANLLCVSQSGFAIEYGEESWGTLEEVIITARKRSESLQETPVAVTAFTSEGLENKGFSNVSQIGQSTPNLQFDSSGPVSGSSSNAVVFIRGIGQNEFLPTSDPGVATYVDQVYISRSIGGVLDLLDIERIEVLRGPQGTLFGKNTIGGAINITTQRPGEDFEAAVEMIVGSDSRVDVRGSVNIPVSDNFYARFSGSSKNRDGYGTRVLTGEELGDVNSDSGRFSGYWAATDHLDVSFSVDATRARESSIASTLLSDGPNVGAIGGGFLAQIHNGCVMSTDCSRLIPSSQNQQYNASQATNDVFTTTATGPNHSDLDVWGVSATIDWDLDSYSAKYITSYRELESGFGMDADNSPIDLVHTDLDLDHKQMSQELQLSKAEDNYSWLVGLYYFEEEALETGPVTIIPHLFVPGVPATAASLEEHLDVQNSNLGAFSQGSYSISDQLSVTIGIRYTKEEKELDVSGFILSDLGLPLVTNPRGQETFEEVTGKLGVEYVTEDLTLIYASYSQGFKSGGFNGRYTRPTTDLVAFAPETVNTYELGVKAEFLESRLRLNTALFHSEYQDIQVVVFDGITPLTRNAAEGSIQGVEVELTYLPAPGWNIDAALGYLDAKYDGVGLQAIANGLTIDKSFVNSPEWTGSFAAQYEYNVLDMGVLLTRLDISYKGELAKDAINTPELIQEPVTLVNARIAFTSSDDHWTLALFGSNLTDEEYLGSGFSDLPTFGFISGTYARGREWGGSVKYRF